MDLSVTDPGAEHDAVVWFDVAKATAIFNFAIERVADFNEPCAAA
jgi:hypothetical protein